MKQNWKERKSLRICLGALLVLFGAIWFITPIPGSAIAWITGLYLINEKWADKKIKYFRDKFRKK